MFRISTLVGKILKSSFNKEERGFVNDFIDGNEVVRVEVKKSLKDGFLKESENIDEAFRGFEKSLRLELEKTDRKKSNITIGVAASVIFMLSSVFVYNVLKSSSRSIDQKELNRDIVLTLPNGEKTIVEETSEIKNELQSFFSQEDELNPKGRGLSSIYVPKGRTYMMELSDGTKVHLNADTELKFPIAFDGEFRKVELIGEGFFEVVSNKKKPFIVVSEGLETKVYGTKFNVSSYTGGIKNQITLVEGSVGVTNVKDNIRSMLKPNQMFTWEKSKDRYFIKEVDVNERISWLRGFVSFNDTSLAEMIPIIERKFDISVELSGKELKSKKFTGKLSVDTVEELQAILDATKVFSCQYQANEKKLLIE